MGGEGMWRSKDCFWEFVFPFTYVDSRDPVQVVSLSRKYLDQMSHFMGFELSNDSK